MESDVPTWRRQFLLQPNLNESATQWTDVMKHVLTNSQVFDSKALSQLKSEDGPFFPDPTIMMNVRHQQTTTNIYKHRPKETIASEARRLIRKEKLEKLAQERELFMVNTEIENLKERIKKQRERYKIDVQNNFLMTKNEESLLKRRLEDSETCARIDSWFSENVNKEMEVITEMKMKVILTPKPKSCQPISAREKEKKKNFEEKNITSQQNKDNKIPELKLQQAIEPTTSKLELLNNKVEESRSYLPSIEAQTRHNRILEVKYKMLTKTFDENLKKKVFLAWHKLASTLKVPEQKELSTKEKKIELFLSRLEEIKKQKSRTVQEDLNEKPKIHSCISQPLLKRSKTDLKLYNRNPIVTAKDIVLKDAEDAVRSKELEKIDLDIENSSKTAFRQLNKNLKEFDPKFKGKVKLLKTVSNIGKDKLEQIENEMRKILPPPEVLIRMEKRNKERRDRWEAIKERKRRIEELKEKEKIEMEEKKRQAEINEKKKKIEDIKEKRRQEKEAEEERKREMQRLKDMNKKAKEIYNKKLLRLVFLPWVSIWEKKKEPRRTGFSSL